MATEKRGRKPWFSTGAELPLVGDWAGVPKRKRTTGKRWLGRELIRRDYPVELGGLEEEGIMGLPTWAVLLGAVVLAGGIYYYYTRQQQVVTG